MTQGKETSLPVRLRRAIQNSIESGRIRSKPQLSYFLSRLKAEELERLKSKIRDQMGNRVGAFGIVRAEEVNQQMRDFVIEHDDLFKAKSWYYLLPQTDPSVVIGGSNACAVTMSLEGWLSDHRKQVALARR
ncbi:hypothetical protein [Ferrimonas marina]|uniref:Uncharacterized protein n=1 Tax=Ferrimonas marina TaxID=299255 RepID=A0A1M5UHB7_9GAMM|nr:hypothetical protein [Ferrimonas marina]SHH62357.1 hypothetical protein SAMN02745129_2572 [Ferrimonas marina]